jgi:NADPH2:quinone reductase
MQDRSAHTRRTRVIAADRLVKVPDDIALDVAASMMLKGMTAEYLLAHL